jgi:hypothetical protein
MSEKNIILRIIEEVHYFKHHLLQSVVINDNQQTFLLLSDEKILDINSLREYLLEKKINKFTKNEIKTLIAKIDACLGLQEKYSKLPIEDCTYEYNYEGKGRALVFGRLKHTKVIKGAFWKSNSTEFDKRISEFKYLNHFHIGGLMIRLRQLKDILAPESYSENEEIISSINKNQKTVVISNELPSNNSIETSNLNINKTVDFNPNHFNKKGNDLFLYLVENYTKEGKIKFVNIFEFMKKGIDKSKYAFRFTQKDYKAFIISNYHVEIKKFKVAEFLYEDAEKGILNSHEQQFDGR